MSGGVKGLLWRLIQFSSKRFGNKSWRLRCFQRGRLKLDDLKFSEKVQNKCTYRIAKLENN